MPFPRRLTGWSVSCYSLLARRQDQVPPSSQTDLPSNPRPRSSDPQAWVENQRLSYTGCAPPTAGRERRLEALPTLVLQSLTGAEFCPALQL